MSGGGTTTIVAGRYECAAVPAPVCSGLGSRRTVQLLGEAGQGWELNQAETTRYIADLSKEAGKERSLNK